MANPTAAEKILAHVRNLERAPLEMHDDGQALSLFLAGAAGLLSGVGGVGAVGSSPPANHYEDSGIENLTQQYDSTNQVMWKRVGNDATRQSFLLALNDVLTAGAFNEDVNVYDEIEHEWTHEGVASGLWDDAGLLLAETEWQDQDHNVIGTDPIGTHVLTALNAFLDEGYTATGTAGVGSYTVTITGPIGRYPLFGGEYLKRFHAGAIDEDLTPPTPILTLADTEEAETELLNFGTVEGSATIAADQGDGDWLLIQAVGDPVSEYPQVTTDPARVLVGADSKTRITPAAPVYPLPRWFAWAGADIS